MASTIVILQTNLQWVCTAQLLLLLFLIRDKEIATSLWKRNQAISYEKKTSNNVENCNDNDDNEKCLKYKLQNLKIKFN